ncbi:MAG: SDR family oxidoreductase [Bacteroidia bacterium]|jgi:3-oxoacyl-[acyl-carrier protein] reductase|nr:SDR family oxidoreductase [Bacteroidia bacterium]
MQLSQAKVLITGGNTGLGYATARLLKQKGATVVIAGRNAETLAQAASELQVHSIQADVSNEADVARMVNEATEKMGGINVLINNAGFGYFKSLTEMDREGFERVFATNVTGAMLTARECARHFVAQQHGNIINIASTAGRAGFAMGTAYAASKFALAGMSECWRAELRPHNVRVMLINPSEVQTGFVENSGREPRPFNPTKLQADDIAHTICALLELDDRAFVTEATVWATNPKN